MPGRGGATTSVRQLGKSASVSYATGLSQLSGLSARCRGRDLAARRAIDKAVYDLRVEIAEACTKQADQRGEPLDDDA